MVLVTKNARYASDSMDGKTRTEAQLETDIITSYEEANNALADSGIDVTLRVVHIESVRARGKLFPRRTVMYDGLGRYTFLCLLVLEFCRPILCRVR